MHSSFFYSLWRQRISREEKQQKQQYAKFYRFCRRKQKDSAGSENQKLQIVTTIFPEYDWVKEILGEKADNTDLTLLLGNGTDMHSFQPTMADILKVSTCDVFIYVGGESDAWVADALKGAGNPDRKAINLMEVLGEKAKAEEIVEGMQDEDGHTYISDEDMTDTARAKRKMDQISLIRMRMTWNMTNMSGCPWKMPLYSVILLQIYWAKQILKMQNFISKMQLLTRKNLQSLIRNIKMRWISHSPKLCFLQTAFRFVILLTITG